MVGTIHVKCNYVICISEETGDSLNPSHRYPYFPHSSLQISFGTDMESFLKIQNFLGWQSFFFYCHGLNERFSSISVKKD